MKTNLTPTLICKEAVSELQFRTREVLNNKLDIEHRKRKLDRATVLGNILHNKVKIIFEDNAGIKQVETTIWAVGDKNIVLKYGLTIPIHSIYDIRIL